MTHGLKTMRRLNHEAVKQARRKARDDSTGDYIRLDKGPYKNTRTREMPREVLMMTKSTFYSARNYSETIPAFEDSETNEGIDDVTEAAFMEARFKQNGTKRACYRDGRELIPAFKPKPMYLS